MCCKSITRPLRRKEDERTWWQWRWVLCGSFRSVVPGGRRMGEKVIRRSCDSCEKEISSLGYCMASRIVSSDVAH